MNLVEFLILSICAKVGQGSELIRVLFSSPISRVGKLLLAEIGSKPVTLTVLICGMLVTYLQYNAYLENEKIEKSFQIVEEWETRGYQAAFSDFGQLVRSLEVEASDLLGDSGENIDGPTLAFVQKRLVEPDVNFDIAISRLFYFFDKMSLCVEQALCHEEMLVEYFGSAAQSFWIYTIAYQSEKRKRDPEFGRYTEVLFSTLSARK